MKKYKKFLCFGWIKLELILFKKNCLLKRESFFFNNFFERNFKFIIYFFSYFILIVFFVYYIFLNKKLFWESKIISFNNKEIRSYINFIISDRRNWVKKDILMNSFFLIKRKESNGNNIFMGNFWSLHKRKDIIGYCSFNEF